MPLPYDGRLEEQKHAAAAAAAGTGCSGRAGEARKTGELSSALVNLYARFDLIERF